jgi:hypothetical protein
MGFDVQGVRFLLSARSAGANFQRTAMIGRQEFFIDPKLFQHTLARFGFQLDDTGVNQLLTEENGFAEPLLRLLGADHISSIDASHYERASVLHDMNHPIPETLRESFSVVVDAGTLEHVFNFPVAIKNCMEMIRVDGHLLMMTPANKFMGHGFYQFSPELFFRVFSGDNGFEVVKAILCEVDPRGQWYSVVDPAKARRRVELINRRPTYLMIQARKVRRVPILVVPPQQSDYKTLWQEADNELRKTAVKPTLPSRVVHRIGRALGAAYRMLEPSGLARRRQRPDDEVFIEVDWRPN